MAPVNSAKVHSWSCNEKFSNSGSGNSKMLFLPQACKEMRLIWPYSVCACVYLSDLGNIWDFLLISRKSDEVEIPTIKRLSEK